MEKINKNNENTIKSLGKSQNEKEISFYRDPTAVELLSIEKTKKLIKEELQTLGIDINSNIDAYNFKFTNKDTGMASYDLKTRIIEINGFYKIELEKILKSPLSLIPMTFYLVQKLLAKIVGLEQDSKTKSNYRNIIHESIHGGSFHKYKNTIFDNNLPIYNMIGDRFFRNGYLLSGDEGEDYFRGLNEGIVDKITIDILFKEHKGESVLVNRIKNFIYHLESRYFIEMLTLDVIIKRIAKEKKEKKDEVWSRFKMGLFTGNMSHLKDIEKIYGTGSLKILASMNPRVNTKNIKNFLYYRYFSTKSNLVRKIIKDKLLLNKS